MTIFDLVFIIVFFVTAIAIIIAAIAAIRGQWLQVRRMLSKLGAFAGAYLLIVIIVSLTSAQKVIPLKEPQCFDDWCIAVDQVERTPAGRETSYLVTLQLSSRALGKPQRENGVQVYLIDEEGRHYDPQPDTQLVPLDVLLDPGEAVLATRRFVLPAAAGHPALVVAHGHFPGMFIIGDDQSPFHKPTLVRW